MENESKNQSLDVLGIKPVSEAVSIVTESTIKGVGKFLGSICLPAAEELGLLLKDKVSSWRANNALAMILKAQELVNRLPNPENRHAHPRIVGTIIEQGSWADEDDVRSMWSGLLATACSESGKNQENLIFVNLLSQLTTAQVRVLNYVCEHSSKYKSETGLILTNDFFPDAEQISVLSGRPDIHVLDLEVDYLRELGLLTMMSGLSTNREQPTELTPSAMAIQLYVRCQGYIGSPIDFFGL